MMERIRIRMEKILEYKNILEDIKGDCEKKNLYDPVYRGALLHYLYLLSDSCISLAEVIIRARSLRTPQSYHDAIDILGENGILLRWTPCQDQFGRF